jgi:hypothetical protein
MPTLLCFNFFPTAQKKLNFIATAQMAHLLLPQPHKPTLRQKQKSHFLANAPTLKCKLAN